MAVHAPEKMEPMVFSTPSMKPLIPFITDSMPDCIMEKSPVVMPMIRPSTVSKMPWMMDHAPWMICCRPAMTDVTVARMVAKTWPTVSMIEVSAGTTMLMITVSAASMMGSRMSRTVCTVVTIWFMNSWM